MAQAASARGIQVIGSVVSEQDAAAAAGSGLKAFAVEAPISKERLAAIEAIAEVIVLDTRAGLLARPDRAILGTREALWPGIRIEDETGKAHSAPSGAPWIDTNGGFLRFVRAMTEAGVWVDARPPAGRAIPVEGYIAAAADAAVSGARWVVTLDDDFQKRLLAREPKALAGWKRFANALQFLEERRTWMRYRPAGQLAIVQDVDSGASYSAGLLDMIGVRHTPARIVPARRLTAESLKGVSLAINIQPATLPAEGREVLREFTRGGGKLFNSPPGWHFPQTGGYVLALEKLSKDELDYFELIWKQITSQTWNRNLGAKLYNVASMLSHLVASPDGAKSYLMLVNYSGYEAENVTVHIPGKFTRAVLHAPESASKPLEIYGIEEGSGVDIEKFGAVGILELEAQR